MNSANKVTPHFIWREFLYSETANREAVLDTDEDLRRTQVLGILAIATTLEYIREWYNEPVRITSGVRDEVIQGVLLEAGIRSSSKSDHSYFSDWYPYGVGAVDFYIEDVPLRTVFNDIINRLPDARYGQAILYETGGFIHLSNPRDFLLNVRREKERHLRKTPDGYLAVKGGTS
jgi:hypothetical protein